MRRREETSASRAFTAARRGRLPPTLPYLRIQRAVVWSIAAPRAGASGGRIMSSRLQRQRAYRVAVATAVTRPCQPRRSRPDRDRSAFASRTLTETTEGLLEARAAVVGVSATNAQRTPCGHAVGPTGVRLTVADRCGRSRGRTQPPGLEIAGSPRRQPVRRLLEETFNDARPELIDQLAEHPAARSRDSRRPAPGHR